MRYFIIGDEDSVLGFGMVGVEGRTVESKEEADAAFTEVQKDRSVGVVIITEEAADMIREKVDALLFSERFPLVVEIPDKNGKKPGRRDLRQMVNEAIGISI